MKQYRCLLHMSEDVIVVVQAGDEAQAQVLGDLAARTWRDKTRPRAEVQVGSPEEIVSSDSVSFNSDADWQTLPVTYMVLG